MMSKCIKINVWNSINSIKKWLMNQNKLKCNWQQKIIKFKIKIHKKISIDDYVSAHKNS